MSNAIVGTVPDEDRKAKHAAYMRAYRASNPEYVEAAAVRARIHGAAAYAADPAKFKARAKAARAADPEATRVKRQAEYRRAAVKRKAEYAENREAYRAKRQARMPEMVAAVKAWREKHPEKTAAFRLNRRGRQAAGGVITAAEIRALKASSGGICAYCLQPSEKLHVEHCAPLCRGGTNTADNCVMACPTCNARKGQKTALEFVFGYPALSASVP